METDPVVHIVDDDRAARDEWGWKPEWDRPAMTRDMLARLGAEPI